MIERHDHLELLALIEADLDAATAAQLRKRLASEPRVLEAIERMRHDRTALRALGEVHVPTDVLDQLETLLARPMLAEPLEPVAGAATENGTTYASPGQFRKQYRRQSLRIRWKRIAVAAVVLLAVMAGVWAAMNGLVNSPNTADERMVASTESTEPAPEAVNSNDLSGTIHHALPPLRESQPMLAKNGESQRPNARAADKPPTLIVADFAIVIQASGSENVEASLASIAGEMDHTVAMVRNFSYAEAARIAEELRIGSGPRRDAEHNPVVASTAGDQTPSEMRLKTLADSVRQQIKTTPAQPSTADSSGQLSGPPEIAPSLEQQLNFSSRGATHSVAVPVAELKSFLERAAMATGQNTSLRMMSSQENSSTTEDALNAWVTERAQVQQAFDRLQSASPDAVVLIPVVIQAAK